MQKLQWHHKQPKYKGGTNDVNNLVQLTPDNHYKLHLLRYYLFNDARDAGAAGLIKGHWISGWEHSEEVKEKIRQKSLGNQRRLGAKLSDFTKNKIRNSLLGFKHSEETKAKFKLRKTRAKKTIINGAVYKSRKEAAKALGLTCRQLYSRGLI